MFFNSFEEPFFFKFYFYLLMKNYKKIENIILYSSIYNENKKKFIIHRYKNIDGLIFVQEFF